MELQFREERIACMEPLQPAQAEQELTQEVRLPETLPDALRVLGVYTQCILRSKEWQEEELSVGGGVTAWVLYEPEEGEPVCTDVWIPFRNRWNVDAGTDGVMQLQLRVAAADARCVSPRKLMLRIGLQSECQAVRKGSKTVFQPPELPRDVQLLQQTHTVLLTREAGEKSLRLEQVQPLPGSCQDAGALLWAGGEAEIQEQKLLTDKAVVRGQLQLQGLVSTAGGICSFRTEQPFSQILPLDGAYSSVSRLEVTPCITALEVSMAAEGKLSVQCGLLLQYQVQEPQSIPVVLDAFSPFRELTPRMQSIRLPREGMPDGKQQAEAALEIPVQSVADVRLVGNSFCVLYYDMDGKLQSARVHWQGEGYGCAGKAEAVQTAQGLLLRSPVTVPRQETAAEELSGITALELGELQEPDPARPGIVVIRPDGRSHWELAKAYGSSVDAIRDANESGGKVLLIPVL